uniref:Uncharacterized protein n=1 Tax=Photinus pyralis TaxID=7054 RepID=A0A1Y1KZQ9_PHOPY
MNNTQISDICRTCLVASEGMVSIQSKNLINSRYISIIEMLNNCLPFKVSENDKLPKQMCNDCLLCLTNAYTFQQRCLSSVVTLRRSIACDHHNSDGTDKKLITEAFINNEHIQKFACNLCTAYFTSSDDLKIHQRLHSDEHLHICNVCKLQLSSSSSLSRHQKLFEIMRGLLEQV